MWVPANPMQLNRDASETNSSIDASITCGVGSSCLQVTSLEPAVAYCSGVPPVTECFNANDLPTTACNINQDCWCV